MAIECALLLSCLLAELGPLTLSPGSLAEAKQVIWKVSGVSHW